MKFNTKALAKLSASFVSLVLFVGCAQSSGSSSASSCARPQGQSAAFRQVLASAPMPNGKSQIIAEIGDSTQFQALQNQLGDSAEIKSLAQNLVSMSFAPSSLAETLIEQAASQGVLKNVEADTETFLIPSESGEESGVLPQAVDAELQLSTHNLAKNTTKGKTIVVAIIDSGVDYTHKDLAPYMWHNPNEIPDNGIDDDHNGFVDDVYGWDFANEDNDPMSDDAPSYHGTHVAGIVKQAALLAEQGINVRIMALKYLDATASGRTSSAIRAIDYAIQNGATVLNNSWGSGSYSPALLNAIERTRKANALFIAAAGNGDSNGDGINIDRTGFYPAGYAVNNIVSVAAADSTGTLAHWSNFGAYNVDLAAPGVSIRSTRNGNTYGILSGTSMAAPYVSGVAAMLWSSRPDLSYTEIRKVLFQSVSKDPSLSGKMSTGGQINRNQASQVAAQYVHDPNDVGAPELSPNDICSR